MALYPNGRRGLAAYHLWGEGGRTSIWLLFIFYLFFASLISSLTPRPLLVLPTHFIAHVLVLAAIGTLVYRSSLRVLERRPAVGRTLHVGAGVSFILAFLAMVGSGAFLDDLTPAALARFDAWFDQAAVFYPPLATLVRPADNLLGPAVWAAGVVVAPVVAMATAARLVREPSPLVLDEVEAPGGRSFHSTFRNPWPSESREIAGVRLFFLKDVLLPTIRNPRGFLIRQWILLAASVTAPVLIWQLRREGRVSEIAAEAALWGVAMAIPSIAAYTNGLGTLGREGSGLALIRPFLRPVTLWSYKVLPVLATVVPHGLVYGAVMGGTASGLGLEPGPVSAAGLGGLAGVVAAVNAVALGFLSPDFARDSVLATGASRTARRLFEILAAYGIGVGIVTRVVTRTGVAPTELFAPMLVIAAGLGLSIGGVITLCAVRRLSLLET